MEVWPQVSYQYDGSFAGFLSCVFESYVHKEVPVCFSTPADPRLSLWPERAVETDRAHAQRVWRSLARRISADAQRLVYRSFLTCLEERELHLWRFIALGYERGGGVMRELTDPRLAVLRKADQHLCGEAQLLRGFVRFSDQGGVLVAEIEPKNRVLPLLRPHFCARCSGEAFVIHDRTHHEALFSRPGRWDIVPVEGFQAGVPDRRELDYRQLWRRFYDAIAIAERYNPKCRMTHMPKRYWNTMTEFQTEAPDGRGSPPGAPPRKELTG